MPSSLPAYSGAGLRKLLIALSLVFAAALSFADEGKSPDDVAAIVVAGVASDATTDALPGLLSALQTKNFGDKVAAVDALGAYRDERVLPVLRALLDNKLAYDATGKTYYLAEKTVYDALTGEVATPVEMADLKRVSVNNRIRNSLKALIASQQLLSPNPARRLAAARELIDTPNADNLGLLETAMGQETDEETIEALRVAMALLRLESTDLRTQLAAIGVLKGQLYPSVRAALSRVAEKAATTPDDSKAVAAAKNALESIEGKLQLNGFLENGYFGIALGAVLLLAAVGLAITFGVMGVINMAHGEMIMLGAYTTFVVQNLMPNHLDQSLFVAIPVAFLFTGLVGVLIERGVIRFLYGRPLETLLATFGISLILQQAVRTVFSPLNQSVSSPSWMSGSFVVNPALSLTYNRLYIIAFSIIVLLALVVLLRKTFFGLQMRAVMQNRPMASSMGIRSGWVDAATFGLGSGIAGIAGVALSQLTNVGPNLGQAYIIDSFMVVVFGGVGNLFGTFVAAMSLGMINKVIEPFSGAVLAKILVLIFIILFIQKRPRGLFALKGRFVEG